METVYADKLFEFLTELTETARSQCKQEIAGRIEAARKYYTIALPSGRYFHLPLTSEFLGESMDALQEVPKDSRSVFTPEQICKAGEYVEAIRQQWFSPPKA